MKKIINGKMYNTETAKEICDWSNTYNRSDFNYSGYTLYLKKTGEFFFHREEYGRNTILLASDIAEEGLQDQRGARITCVEDFVAAYGDTDTYEELFGHVEE